MNEVVNYSEFNTLAQCEQRWVYGYQRQLEEEGPRTGLHLGTLLHLGYGLWLTGQYAEGVWLPPRWTDDISNGGKPGVEHTIYLHDFDTELSIRAFWLLERFVAHYGSTSPSSWRVIGSESWMSTAMRGVTLVGRSDGLVEIEGESDEADGLWLIEAKSYGSKGRLDYIHVDPQLVTYKRLVESTYGREIKGVLYEGIYTYQWKPQKPTQAALIEEQKVRDPRFAEQKAADQRAWAREAVERHPGVERPPAESFERRYVDITPDHIATHERYITAAVYRRAELRDFPEEAIPNIGQGCRSCGFKRQCWSDLAGVEEPDDPEIEFDPNEELI